MNKMVATDDELPDWLWDIAEKHDIGTRADMARGGTLVLFADAHGLMQEITAAMHLPHRVFDLGSCGL